MHHRTADRPGTRPAVTHVNRPGTLLAVGLVVGALALAGCSPNQPTASTSSGATGTSSSAAGGTVVLVTHDSFALPDDLIKKFESDTGLNLQVRAQGDAGAMVNQLVLTKDAPIGDVVFGIDNTFASRAVSEGVLQPYRATLPGRCRAVRVRRLRLAHPDRRR